MVGFKRKVGPVVVIYEQIQNIRCWYALGVGYLVFVGLDHEFCQGSDWPEFNLGFMGSSEALKNERPLEAQSNCFRSVGVCVQADACMVCFAERTGRISRE